MMKFLTVPIIGTMRSPYREKFGIPRQPNLVEVESFIEMHVPYDDALAFEGIEQFSHLWLIWQFHDNKQAHNPEKFRSQVRPPRLGGNKKIGVFATRSMYRPAPLGLSVVKFKKIEKQNKILRLYVNGSDLLDGTPIIDIKPYIHYSDALPAAQSGYAQEQPTNKEVFWSEQALVQQHNLLQQQRLTPLQLQELSAILSLDPRPAYQQDNNRVYIMKFADVEIHFNVNEHYVKIIAIS